MNIIVDTWEFSKAIENKISKFSRKTDRKVIEERGEKFKDANLLLLANLFLEQVAKNHLKWFQGALTYDKSLFSDNVGHYQELTCFFEEHIPWYMGRYEEPSTIIYDEATVAELRNDLFASEQEVTKCLEKGWDIMSDDSSERLLYLQAELRSSSRRKELQLASRLVSRVTYKEGKKTLYFPRQEDLDNYLFASMVIEPCMGMAESLLKVMVDGDEWHYWDVMNPNRTKVVYADKGCFLRRRALELISAGSREFSDNGTCIEVEYDPETLEPEPDGITGQEYFAGAGSAVPFAVGAGVAISTPLVAPPPSRQQVASKPLEDFGHAIKEKFTMPSSVFIRGHKVPVITGTSIARELCYVGLRVKGGYVPAELINDIGDITGTVVDSQGNVLLTQQQFDEGICVAPIPLTTGGWTTYPFSPITPHPMRIPRQHYTSKISSFISR